jgi:hypothetical protein
VIIMAVLLIAGRYGLAKPAHLPRAPTPAELEKKFALHDAVPGTTAGMLMANAQLFKRSCIEANIASSMAWTARVTKKLRVNEYEFDLALHRPMGVEHVPVILHTTLSTFSSDGILPLWKTLCVLKKYTLRKTLMASGFDASIMMFVEDPRPPADDNQ